MPPARSSCFGIGSQFEIDLIPSLLLAARRNRRLVFSERSWSYYRGPSAAPTHTWNYGCSRHPHFNDIFDLGHPRRGAADHAECDEEQCVYREVHADVLEVRWGLTSKCNRWGGAKKTLVKADASRCGLEWRCLARTYYAASSDSPQPSPPSPSPSPPPPQQQQQQRSCRSALSRESLMRLSAGGSLSPAARGGGQAAAAGGGGGLSAGGGAIDSSAESLSCAATSHASHLESDGRSDLGSNGGPAASSSHRAEAITSSSELVSAFTTVALVTHHLWTTMAPRVRTRVHSLCKQHVRAMAVDSSFTAGGNIHTAGSDVHELAAGTHFNAVHLRQGDKARELITSKQKKLFKAMKHADW